VPSDTDEQIQEIIAKIRKLCGAAFSDDGEDELRKLAKELRAAIKQHVRMASSSLRTKKDVIDRHDPDAHDPDAEMKSGS
jgi:hypothetical protein